MGKNTIQPFAAVLRETKRATRRIPRVLAGMDAAVWGGRGEIVHSQPQR